MPISVGCTLSHKSTQREERKHPTILALEMAAFHLALCTRRGKFTQSLGTQMDDTQNWERLSGMDFWMSYFETSLVNTLPIICNF